MLFANDVATRLLNVVDVKQEPLDLVRECTGVLVVRVEEFGVELGVDQDALVGRVGASVTLGVPSATVVFDDQAKTQ